MKIERPAVKVCIHFWDTLCFSAMSTLSPLRVGFGSSRSSGCNKAEADVQGCRRLSSAFLYPDSPFAAGGHAGLPNSTRVFTDPSSVFYYKIRSVIVVICISSKCLHFVTTVFWRRKGCVFPFSWQTHAPTFGLQSRLPVTTPLFTSFISATLSGKIWFQGPFGSSNIGFWCLKIRFLF